MKFFIQKRCAFSRILFVCASCLVSLSLSAEEKQQTSQENTGLAVPIEQRSATYPGGQRRATQ